MRPLTFGILVSAGLRCLGDDNLAPASDRAVEGVLDLRSASDLIDALGSLGYRAVPIPADDDLDMTLRRADLDAFLCALHGPRGGQGDVQSLLALRGLPYAGPSAASVALAFDKVRARQMLAYHNLPVPASVALGPSDTPSERALQLLGWPCMVKPRRGSQGLGITRVECPEDVRPAVERAMDVDHELVLERAISGREVQVVMLGERVLGSAEILQRARPGGEGLEMVCPPQMSRGRIDGIHNLARRSVSALGLQDGLSRVDVMVSSRHNEVILEVEPLPPLHRDGVVARVALAAGVSYDALVADLVDRIVLRAPQESRPAASMMLQ
jgi:D-alanine-D-alanine ligase